MATLATYTYSTATGPGQFDWTFSAEGTPPREWKDPRTMTVGELDYWQDAPAYTSEHLILERMARLLSWDDWIEACEDPEILRDWHTNGLPEYPTRTLLRFVAEDDDEYAQVRAVYLRCLGILAMWPRVTGKRRARG